MICSGVPDIRMCVSSRRPSAATEGVASHVPMRRDLLMSPDEDIRRYNFFERLYLEAA